MAHLRKGKTMDDIGTVFRIIVIAECMEFIERDAKYQFH